MTLANVVKACVQYIHGNTTELSILTQLAKGISFTSLDSSHNSDKFGKSLDAILHKLSTLARSKDSIMEIYPLNPDDARIVEQVLIKILHRRFREQAPNLYKTVNTELDDPRNTSRTSTNPTTFAVLIANFHLRLSSDLVSHPLILLPVRACQRRIGPSLRRPQLQSPPLLTADTGSLGRRHVKGRC